MDVFSCRRLSRGDGGDGRRVGGEEEVRGRVPFVLMRGGGGVVGVAGCAEVGVCGTVAFSVSGSVGVGMGGGGYCGLCEVWFTGRGGMFVWKGEGGRCRLRRCEGGGGEVDVGYWSGGKVVRRRVGGWCGLRRGGWLG
ncbi:hypothetical protein Tco_1370062 [Tanacetum coccineum]